MENNTTVGKIITCKAAVCWGPEKPFEIEEIQVDPPQDSEVRIRIRFTSICHTDLSSWKGENEAQRAYPRIFGHEASGVVESVGKGVKDIEEGDNVITIFHGECGECKYCKCQRTNVCEKYGVDAMKKVMASDGKTRFWTKEEDKKPIFHFLNTSTFSEYTVVESCCVVKMDPRLPLKKMTLLSCGVSTGVGGAWNAADVQEGSSVAIFGLGSVGLAVAAGARARGASKIIGVDINPDKFVKARALGITDFINPEELGTAVNEEIKKMTGGGVDYSFECAGNLIALREAFLSTQKGWGVTILLGVQTRPDTLPIHPMELFSGQRIIGSVFGDFKGKTQLPHFAWECVNGKINLDEFITHELPFEKINEAMQLLVEGKSLRCLLLL